MATDAEQAVIDAARAYVNFTDDPDEPHFSTLREAVKDLDVEQAPQAPYAVGQRCGYLDHKSWLVAEVQAIEPAPKDQHWVVDLAIQNGSEPHHLRRTVNAAGVGENVAPLRTR